MKFTPYDRTPRELSIESYAIGRDDVDAHYGERDARQDMRTNKYGRSS
jgi:hypothetical protein